MKITEYDDYTIIAEYNRRFKSVSEKASKAADVYNLFIKQYAKDNPERDREHFYVMFLNGQNELIAIEKLFSGSITTAAVYPREVIKAVLKNEAAYIILAHNHPSGSLDPSNSDRALTKKLQTACQAIDVEILDHIIVGKTDYFSFADHRLL